jgi:hypothetical protein
MVPRHAACSDNAFNAAACSTAAGRYVTGTLGGNITGAAGDLDETIPVGFYDGSQSFTASDADLIAANIVSGVNLFGVNGLMVPRLSNCSDNSLNGSACSTAAGRYVTATLGGNITGAAGDPDDTIPAGFYNNTQTFTASDADLIAANIVSGVNLFGVNGLMVPRHAACSDNALNGSACSTAGARYVTGTLGSDINAAAGALSATIPLGFYNGTQDFTASDADLIANNIKDTISIFGVTGSATAALAACVDDTQNASQCSTAASRYVTATASGSVTLTTSTSASITDGFQSGSNTCSVSDTDLIARSIKSGVNILGVEGMYLNSSKQHRSVGTTLETQETEVVTNAGMAYTQNDPGYRVVPRIASDDIGQSVVATVNRTGWAATTCGTAQATIEARIADCATTFGATATWDGRVNGNRGEGVWKLVSRTADMVGTGTTAKGREVWRDEKTGLLWSSKVTNTSAADGINWCKASGANNITNNPAAEDDPADFCDNATYQNTGVGPAVKAVSACFEDGGNYFTDVDPGGKIDSSGKAGLGLSSTPAVAWRLPNAYDYFEAHNNGLLYVVPDAVATSPNDSFEWTATTIQYTAADYSHALWIDGKRAYGWGSLKTKVDEMSARCVGR